MSEFFFFLLLTINIEFIILYLFFKKDWKLVLFYTVLINCFTWPLAILLVAIGISFLGVEAGVVLVESIFLKFLLQLGL